jgi:hypothetical protein
MAVVMESNPSTWKRIISGTLSGTVLGIIGFYIASAGIRGMGPVMFFLVPVVAGIVIGWMIRGGKAVGISAIVSLIGALFFLIAMGKEGLLCALLAFPFLAVAVLFGVLLGIGLRIAIKPNWGQNITAGLFMVASPFLIFGGKQVERPLLEETRIEAVSTTIHVADTPSNIWGEIQSIDSLKGSKPWLMYVGLPIPERCKLEKAAVGARRTCYFNKGYIEETVTGWDPPRHMGLHIDRTHMPGRHWLGFENADYWLQPDGEGTLLTRTTTISSHLYPAWYWRPLERLGVESEHQYLLQYLANRANGEQVKQ